MTVLDDKEFDAHFGGATPLVVKFFSMWDSKSRSIESGHSMIADELRTNARFMQSNVNSNPDLAEKFGVKNVPAVIIFKNGEVLARIATFDSKRALKEHIEKIVSRKF